MEEAFTKKSDIFGILSTRKADLEHIGSLATNAREAQESAEKLRSSIGGLDSKIDKLYREANEVRQKREDEVRKFSSTFDFFIKGLMGEEVTGVCEFAGRNIALRVDRKGDLTSAAIETVKLLAFDLAAVASSVEGRGFHPRFLIHDGPREADMSGTIYDHLFILARLVEEAFPSGAEPSFQYIVTTTTPPPEEMGEGKKWLLHPILSASQAQGRLLKVDL